MYSLIMMMAATTGGEVPHGLLHARGSCTGRTPVVVSAPCAPVQMTPVIPVAPVRVTPVIPVTPAPAPVAVPIPVSTGCSGVLTEVRARAPRSIVKREVLAPLATINANRPHLVRRLFTPRAGCAGTLAYTAPVTDCGGVVVGFGPVQAAPAAGGPMLLGERITRALVHRNLAAALRHEKAGSLTPAQKAAVAACLSDPDIYDCTVIRVTKKLRGTAVPAGMEGRFAAIGDGHILEILLAHLPEIVAAIEEIIKLFALGHITLEQMYVLMDQALEPIRAVLDWHGWDGPVA